MDMPDQDWFESRKNDAFTIQFDENNHIDCQIEDITQSQAPSTKAGQNQFSVVFSKPSPEVFEQGLYQISHPDVGDFSLFLVPVFGDEQGVHYEAIFT